MAYRYIGNCVSSDAQSIWDMREKSRRVTWRTFRQHCPDARQFFEDQGAFWEETTHKQIEDSGFFDCHKSTYRGIPCYFADWSGFEWIWTKRGENGND